MGFPEKLVSKAIEETGEDNPHAILNWLLTLSSLEHSPAQQLSTNSDPCSSDYNEICPNDISDIDSWSDDEIEECLKDNGAYKSEKHKMLLSLAASGSLSENERKKLDLVSKHGIHSGRG